MNVETEIIEFGCKAGHRFRAKRARSVNCIALEFGEACLEDAHPVGSVRTPRTKESPAWAGFDIYGNPVPANEAARRISDGETAAVSRRREN